MAAGTQGTNDILHWIDFVNADRQYGPVHMYTAHLPNSYYNHPPLMGYVLLGVNLLRDVGIPIRFTIRALTSVAAVGSAFVVYGLVRRRRGEKAGLGAGLLVALSPVLFTIAGFHGNTDPLFSMLVLLSAYLLVDKEQAAGAGVVIALACGVKFVAIVAAPALLAYAITRGRSTATRFCVAAAVTLALTWGPALLLEWSAVKQHVFGYVGLGLAQWGLMQFGHWAGDPSWVAWARGSGRFTIVLACALLPALGVLRRPQSAAIAVALSLCAFLALSPEFAVQYLAWGAAATCVITAWGGLFFNVFAGWLLIEVYNRWSHGFFAVSGRDAHYQPLTPHETVFAVIAWAALVATCWRGVRIIWSTPREGRRHRRPPPRFVRHVSDGNGAEAGPWPGPAASTRTLPVTLGKDGA